MVRRLIWMALIVGAIYFALQAGEYSTTDILKLRKQRVMLQTQVDSLKRQVDSLKTVEKMISSDPATQERIAREVFGMVRGTNEILYKFVEKGAATDSSKDSTR